MMMFWARALAIALLLYVSLDGFDLGIGILFAFAGGETRRRHMMDAVSPVWDGNETWLVVAGATLYGAFPAAYAVLVSAFYLPAIVMLGSLILRGVAFEFRNKAQRFRWMWSVSFCGGSVVASFAQGAMIGAFVQQIPVHDGRFAGTLFSWFSPFAVLCGVGLCLGYAMLGAGWLILKMKGETRALGYRAMPFVLGGVVVFLIAAAGTVFGINLQISHRWLQRPFLFVFPVIGAVALLAMVYGLWRRVDRIPYPAGVAMFFAAFMTMVLSVLPYMVPFSLTIAQAASSPSSLAFLFWGAGIVVLPITVAYTAVIYYIFRGKVSPSS